MHLAVHTVRRAKRCELSSVCSVRVVIVTSTKEVLCIIVVVCLSVCLFDCQQLCTTTSERTCMKFSGKVGNGPVNKWLHFGGDPDHCLDTGIVFRIRHCWEIRKVVSTDCACATLQCSACTSRRRHSNYDVTASLALGGGMHSTSASSFH